VPAATHTQPLAVLQAQCVTMYMLCLQHAKQAFQPTTALIQASTKVPGLHGETQSMRQAMTGAPAPTLTPTPAGVGVNQANTHRTCNTICQLLEPVGNSCICLIASTSRYLHTIPSMTVLGVIGLQDRQRKASHALVSPPCAPWHSPLVSHLKPENGRHQLTARPTKNHGLHSHSQWPAT
jgi:hypothetical protein